MAGYLLEMFGTSLALTILIEPTVIFLFLRFGRRRIPEVQEKAQTESGRRTMIRYLLLSVPVNVLTNPPAVLLCWLGRMYLGQGWELPVQLSTEVLVVAAEAWVYCGFAKKPGWEIPHPAVMAAAANVSSYLMGGLLNKIA